MEFINAVRNLGVSRKHSKHNDDLFVDRLNHRYTVSIIVLFALTVTLSQYGGNPINCWVPGHFTGNYANYAENICWVSSTYNVPLNEDLPNNEEERKTKMLKYYQWTPFILLFQALLFYLPRMIWRSLNDKSGLDIQSFVDAVYNFNTDVSKYAEKQKLMNYLTNTFDNYVRSIKVPNEFTEYSNNDTKDSKPGMGSTLRSRNVENLAHDEKMEKNMLDNEDESETEWDQLNTENSKYRKTKFKKFWFILNRFSKIACITKGKRYGNYLMALFVFVKLMYTINSIFQLFLLNHFLGNDYLLLGIEVLNKIWTGDDWAQLKRFPRVTMCDFRIREVGIVHRYSVQCVLSINLFNEKIFIFLWFWLCIVSFFNVYDLISWSYSLIINTHERYIYVKRRLTALNSLNANLKRSDSDKRMFKKFVNNYLREDGVLALRLMSKNSQDLIVSEIISNLFNMYKSQYRQDKLAFDYQKNNSEFMETSEITKNQKKNLS